MEPPNADRRARFQALLTAAAAAASLALGLAPILGLPCETCAEGLAALALPWTGAAVYAILTVLLLRFPASGGVSAATGATVFIHACLVAEAALARRICVGCCIVAALAVGAAALQAWRRPQDRLPLAAGLLLGAVAAISAPFERLDDWVTRRTWPARLLRQVPDFVDREETLLCEHRAPVRILAYDRDCQSCGSASRRILPRLIQEFGARICVHPHSVARPKRDPSLPLLVLVSSHTRVVVVQGMPSYEGIRGLVQYLVEGKEAPAELPSK